VRLISATHLPLNRYLETDHFRKDLFYRISGITLRLPALRHRPNDLRSVAAASIAAASRAQGKEIVGLSRAAADKLLSYDWPGNLRELNRVIHTAVAIADGEILTPETLLLENSIDAAPASDPARPSGSIPPDSLTGAPAAEDLSLRAAEVRHIRAVLERMQGNKRRAARALGLSRSTLDRKLGHHEH